MCAQICSPVSVCGVPKEVNHPMADTIPGTDANNRITCQICFGQNGEHRPGCATNSPRSYSRFTLEWIDPLSTSRMRAHWRVMDTQSQSPVASCFDSDNARMVRDALNAYFCENTEPPPERVPDEFWKWDSDQRIKWLDNNRREWINWHLASREGERT